MGSLVPNIDDLIAALPVDGPGAQLARAFTHNDLGEARRGLVAVVAGWESQVADTRQDDKPASRGQVEP